MVTFYINKDKNNVLFIKFTVWLYILEYNIDTLWDMKSQLLENKLQLGDIKSPLDLPVKYTKLTSQKLTQMWN